MQLKWEVLFCLPNSGIRPENWYKKLYELAISVLLLENILVTDKGWNEMTERNISSAWAPHATQVSTAQTEDELVPVPNPYALLF